MFIKPIFYFAVRKFVCTPRATTNINFISVKARLDVPFTLLHIYWICQYKLFFNIIELGGVY